MTWKRQWCNWHPLPKRTVQKHRKTATEAVSGSVSGSITQNVPVWTLTKYIYKILFVFIFLVAQKMGFVRCTVGAVPNSCWRRHKTLYYWTESLGQVEMLTFWLKNDLTSASFWMLFILVDHLLAVFCLPLLFARLFLSSFFPFVVSPHSLFFLFWNASCQSFSVKSVCV